MVMANTSEFSKDGILGEKDLARNGFLQDAKCNSGMEKNNFPENTIFYVNQA